MPLLDVLLKKLLFEEAPAYPAANGHVLLPRHPKLWAALISKRAVTSATTISPSRLGSASPLGNWQITMIFGFRGYNLWWVTTVTSKQIKQCSQNCRSFVLAHRTTLVQLIVKSIDPTNTPKPNNRSTKISQAKPTTTTSRSNQLIKTNE